MVTLWLPAAAQAAAAAWLVVRWSALEAARWPSRWRLYIAAALVAAAVATHLPWLASWLMPDLFTGLMLLALLLLAEHWRALPAWERVLVVIFLCGTASTHLSHLPLLLGLGLFALVASLLPPMRRAAAPLRRAVALALGAAAVAWGALVLANVITYGQATTSLGQSTMLFARLNADGDAAAVLRPHCEAGASWAVCNQLDRLGGLSEQDFLWRDAISPLPALGYVQGFYVEARELNPILLHAYWPDWLAASARRAVEQILRFELGDGMDDEGPLMLVRDLDRFGLGRLVPDIAATRQFENGLLPWMPRGLAEGIGAVGLLALTGLAGLGLARGRPDVSWPALLFLVAWVGNAALVGLASEVFGRYGARLIWLAPLVAIVLTVRVARPGPLDVAA